MKLSISKKFAKRSIKCLALFAPLAYLFGSLFFGLNGDHAGKFLDDAISTVTPAYDYLMIPEHFSYGAFDWVNHNEDKTRIGFSLGYLAPEISVSTDLEFIATPYGISSYNNGYIIDNHGLGFSGNIDSSFIDYHLVIDSDTQMVDDNYIDDSYLADDSYFCFYVSEDYSQWPWHILACVVYSDDVLVWHYNRTTNFWDTLSWSDVDFFDWYQPKFFFDDGKNLPSQVVWDDELRSYFVPSVKPVESTSSTDYIFGQFFQKDNFLVQWGQNCISENPVGFAPFGAFFKFLDENILHLSDSQIGLMGYGYIYYCLHVLIAFLAFDCVAFIPQLIMKVVHQFNKGVDSDD